MRKLPKAFSYSDYLSERWIPPLWAIKPIDYLIWLLKAWDSCLTDICLLHPEHITEEWFYDTTAFRGSTVPSTHTRRQFTQVNDGVFGDQQCFLATITDSHTSARTHICSLKTELSVEPCIIWFLAFFSQGPNALQPDYLFSDEDEYKSQRRVLGEMMTMPVTGRIGLIKFVWKGENNIAKFCYSFMLTFKLSTIIPILYRRNLQRC